jgi:high-affinity iron transporter
MYASAIIVFREVLEAALVVSIVLAASNGIRRRNLTVVAGGIAGLSGAALVALFADAIAGAVEGIGQELFNAGVLSIAVGMLAWHNIWMAKHARSLVSGLKTAGVRVQSGEKPLYFLGILIAVALLREGSEVVLFLYGIAASGSSGATMLLGGLAGLLAGVMFGIGIYAGLLRIPTRYLFQATGWMILFLAAGMASQATRFLMQAGILPDQMPMWDSSRILPPDSIAGQFLHAFAGYEATPAPLQIVVYVATIVLIALGMRILGRQSGESGAGAAAAQLST